MARLLLAEDDRDLGPAMKHALELKGHRVDLVARGDEVVAAVSTTDYALILLDIGLPCMTGLEALTEIRAAHSDVPVIIITARDRPIHKIAGLDAGADDYVVKPFDMEELAARIRARLRRREGLNANSISIGDVTIDLSGNVVTKAGQSLSLTAQEFRVLALLMRRSRRFVTRADIESEIYDQEQWAESNTVEVAIWSLRRKLGRAFILTTRGLGYMVGHGAE